MSDKKKKLISIFEITLIFAGYVLYNKKKKHKEQIQIQEAVRKEIERRNLDYKVNRAFEEVLQLAKQNDTSFLARFREVYPEFCKKILDLYPDILNSELVFFAYLKLNFSTKEIASYTFVTEKAVQTRKSRIRKKLKIPSDEDLYIWINKIYP